MTREYIVSKLFQSYTLRKRYSLGTGLLVFGMSMYHGYKLSNRELLREKYKIRNNPENILEQLY